MNNTIIKIESGVVADIYSTDPVQAIIVDYDTIEGDETAEHRMKKGVLQMMYEQFLWPENLITLRRSCSKCSRPEDRLLPVQVGENGETAA